MGGEAASDLDLGVEVLEVLQVPALVGVGEDEVERPRQLFTSSWASASLASTSAATPASSRLRTASAWREGSISMVVSFPPVFESAQAIHTDEWPVEVPISARGCGRS